MIGRKFSIKQQRLRLWKTPTAAALREQRQCLSKFLPSMCRRWASLHNLKTKEESRRSFLSLLPRLSSGSRRPWQKPGACGCKSSIRSPRFHSSSNFSWSTKNARSFFSRSSQASLTQNPQETQQRPWARRPSGNKSRKMQSRSIIGFLVKSSRYPRDLSSGKRLWPVACCLGYLSVSLPSVARSPGFSKSKPKLRQRKLRVMATRPQI